MTRFVKNPDFEREIQHEAEFKLGMTAKTDETAEAVKQAAPDKTGYYKKHIRAFSRVNAKAVGIDIPGRGDRLKGTLPKGDDYVVVSTDPFGHLVEWGSVNNPPYAPLQRGARAAGLRIEENPK